MRLPILGCFPPLALGSFLQLKQIADQRGNFTGKIQVAIVIDRQNSEVEVPTKLLDFANIPSGCVKCQGNGGMAKVMESDLDGVDPTVVSPAAI